MMLTTNNQGTGENKMQDIVAEESENKPVIINAESGSTVTVNINVRNYGYPEWFDQKAFNCLISALGGRVMPS